MNDNFVKVDEWSPNEEDNIVKPDGKLMIIPFDKLFKREYIESINTFIIKKDSYVKRLNNIIKKDKNTNIKSIEYGICHYINYFLKFYDTNYEILFAYIKLKYLIDNKSTSIKLNAFIKLIYSILFTDSIISKISNMVEDNYYIEVSKKTDKKYNEAMKFTTEHAKIMMKISMSMKLMVPVMFHYINSNNLGKDKNYIFLFYQDLFNLYDKDVDIYNKLYMSTLAKVNFVYTKNKGIWEQREIFGTDPLLYINVLLKDKIISETMFKYTFNKNIISFNSVVLDKQLGYFLIEPYDYTPIELSNLKDSEGLSGLDKLEMNSSKIDESLIILSSINIKKTIKKIKKQININITKEELQFYKKHFKFNKFQVQLIFYNYAKYFGGYRDLNLLTRTQFLELMILLKKKLQILGNIYLPQILSANITKLNSRTIQNSKFLSKIENSSTYQVLIKEKFNTLEELNKSNLILKILSTAINSTFTYVDYDNKDKLNQQIEINEDVLSDEILSLLNQI